MLADLSRGERGEQPDEWGMDLRGHFWKENASENQRPGKATAYILLSEIRSYIISGFLKMASRSTEISVLAEDVVYMYPCSQIEYCASQKEAGQGTCPQGQKKEQRKRVDASSLFITTRDALNSHSAINILRLVFLASSSHLAPSVHILYILSPTLGSFICLYSLHPSHEVFSRLYYLVLFIISRVSSIPQPIISFYRSGTDPRLSKPLHVVVNPSHRTHDSECHTTYVHLDLHSPLNHFNYPSTPPDPQPRCHQWTLQMKVYSDTLLLLLPQHP
jgi:hypothetical protein